MLYDDFKPIVDIILNNWTALQLAVEHGMGAPGGEKVYLAKKIFFILHSVGTKLLIMWKQYKIIVAKMS